MHLDSWATAFCHHKENTKDGGIEREGGREGKNDSKEKIEQVA